MRNTLVRFITLTLAVSFCAPIAFADSFEIIRDGKTYTCTATGEGNGTVDDYLGCAEVSLEKFGMVLSDCKKVKNDSQDICAGKSIRKFGLVMGDCLKLIGGARCAVVSVEKYGCVTSDCLKL